VPKDVARRSEILDAAATLFASSGLRTTLRDIADASGILAGSLYHHFDSKEAIIIELVRRYQAELDDVGHVAMEALRQPDPRPAAELIVDLGQAIADCAVRHRAALLLTFYEPPAGMGKELSALAARTPTVIQTAMLETLRAGRASGYLGAEVGLNLLADRLCQSMLHIGIGVSHRSAGAHRMAALRCQALLDGIAARPLSGSRLDRSAAILAADSVIATWREDPVAAQPERAALIRATARAEFGRRGYEATTMRHIAAAAGVDVRSVYRVIESKEQLFATIMRGYVTSVTAGWNAVLRAPSTPVERLDALIWLNINVVDRFGPELRIQLAGLRQTPPDNPDLAWTFPSQLRQVKALLSEGARSGDLRFEGGSAELRARCLFELLWTPESILRAVGTRGALELLRATVLRGAASRGTAGRQDRPAERPRVRRSAGRVG
jgi:AcrR family transcriptional regulator